MLTWLHYVDQCLRIDFCWNVIRYKREEVKIQAWENHEKRKAEMEIKKMEVRLSSNGKITRVQSLFRFCL